MVESRLVTRKNEIELELKRGVRDPKRKQHLIANLLKMEEGIKALDFSEEEIKTNDFNYRGAKKDNKTP